MSNDTAQTTDTAIRLTMIALLAISCFRIVGPFIAPVAWGMVIAIATSGFYARLLSALGGRSKTTAAVFLTMGLATLILPAVMLSDTLISGAHHFAGQLAEGTIVVPPPPASVEDWPLIGKKLYPFWLLASQNLQAAAEQLKPQLKALSKPMLAMASSAGLGLLQMFLSIIIATAFLINSQGAAQFAQRLARRIAGTRGKDLASLASSAISTVAVGILGVAVTQAILAGIGFLAAGIPGAGLWALFVLIFAVIQFPVIVLMIPLVIYGSTALSTSGAIVFGGWCLFVALVDNVLKPILFAKGGGNVPVLVIFLGSIGGMLSAGLIGLFVGPVILAVGYEVARSWIADADALPYTEP